MHLDRNFLSAAGAVSAIKSASSCFLFASASTVNFWHVLSFLGLRCSIFCGLRCITRPASTSFLLLWRRCWFAGRRTEEIPDAGCLAHRADVFERGASDVFESGPQTYWYQGRVYLWPRIELVWNNQPSGILRITLCQNKVRWTTPWTLKFDVWLFTLWVYARASIDVLFLWNVDGSLISRILAMIFLFVSALPLKCRRVLS